MPRLIMARNFLPYRVRWSEYTSSNGCDGCDRLVAGLMGRLVAGFMVMLVAEFIARLVAGFVARLVAGFVARLVVGLSEAISTLTPRVVWLVLRAEISPWAPSFFPTSCKGDQAKCLSMMMWDFLPCWGR